MEYLFFEHGVNSGHVIFKNEGRGALVEVSEGRGSATNVHTFRLQRELNLPFYDTNSKTRFCRIAIAKFLARRGAFTSMDYIDDRGELWNGKLKEMAEEAKSE